MGGASSSVLLKRFLSSDEQELLKAKIKEISSQVSGDNFWISNTLPIGGAGRTERIIPASLNICDVKLGGTYEPSELEIIKRELGYLPRQELGIDVFINGDAAHRVLGELSLFLADQFDGFIDFCGFIVPEKSRKFGKGNFENSWEDVRSDAERWASSVPGIVFAVPYVVSEERNWAYHISDIEFMKWWLQQPDFHMVK